MEDEVVAVGMSEVMEDMREEAAREARRKHVVESVHRWLSMGLSHERIAEGESISLDQVREMAALKRA